jgi:thiol-disulfide isomerase/thioredoxin
MLILAITAASLLAAQPADSPVPAEPATGVVWSQSYDVGMKVAQMEQSPILLFFSASWCPWCRKLEQEVLTQPQVASELRKFICVKLDVDKNRDVALAYGITSLPKVIVVNTYGEIIGDWLGYRDTREFLQLIADIQPYMSTSAGARKAPQVVKAAAEGPSAQNDRPIQAVPDDPNRLMDLLGHKEPKIRLNVIDILVKGGVAILPAMLDTLNNDYLGVRITAWKIVGTLSPTKVEFDPWASRAERAEAIKKLQEEIGGPREKPSSAGAPVP